ncbi:histone-lysine n-methyltransferase atxr3 [Hordeum vulgare]|nr:histone-lysine n-methyltransferase atxr3 [Hordeum vulgare]
MTALSAAGDVAIPEEQPVAMKEEVQEEQPVSRSPESGGQRWTWSCTATEMAQGVGAEPWCPMPPQSPERESSMRGEVVQAPLAPPTFHGSPAHLWTMPPYIDLTGDDDDNGGA